MTSHSTKYKWCQRNKRGREGQGVNTRWKASMCHGYRAVTTSSRHAGARAVALQTRDFAEPASTGNIFHISFGHVRHLVGASHRSPHKVDAGMFSVNIAVEIELWGLTMPCPTFSVWKGIWLESTFRTPCLSEVLFKNTENPRWNRRARRFGDRTWTGEMLYGHGPIREAIHIEAIRRWIKFKQGAEDVPRTTTL